MATILTAIDCYIHLSTYLDIYCIYSIDSGVYDTVFWVKEYDKTFFKYVILSFSKMAAKMAAKIAAKHILTFIYTSSMATVMILVSK